MTAFQGADIVLVGGGQLLMDNDLSFPTRISASVSAARKLGIPVVMHSVGVGKSWTSLGQKLVQSALICDNVKAIIVRDRVSKARIQSLFPHVNKPVLVGPDPALIADRVYEREEVERAGVGVGIIAASAIVRHAKGHVLAGADARKFWVTLCQDILKRGKTIRIFCNGAPEDWQEALAVFGEVSKNEQYQDKITLSDRPTTGLGLINILGACELVVAARLHASIVATALGVPIVGISWDDKVDSFYYERGISRYCVNNAKRSQDVVDVIFDAFDRKSVSVDNSASVELEHFGDGMRLIEGVMHGRMVHLSSCN